MTETTKTPTRAQVDAIRWANREEGVNAPRRDVLRACYAAGWIVWDPAPRKGDVPTPEGLQAAGIATA